MDTLRILVISDLHECQANLDMLIQELKGKNYDKLFICGDFMNLSKEQCLDPDMKNQSIKHINEVIDQLRTGFQLGKDSIIIIPGNHDHNEFFINCDALNPLNIHKRSIHIAEGLFVVGQGGAVPGYDIATGEIAFDGFPYNNEEEYNKDLQDVLELEKEISKTSQFIHMSHTGPSMSSTSIIEEGDGKPLKSGSDSLNTLLKERRDKMLFLVHGHSHYGLGIFNYIDTRVINPGSLRYNGSYGEIVLKSVQQEWKVKSSTIGYFKL